MDRIEVRIDNPSLHTGKVFNDEGWQITYNGDVIDIANVELLDPEASVQIFRLSLNQSDADLKQNTAADLIDVTYTQQAGNSGAWHEVGVTQLDNILSAAAETDYMPPVPVSATFDDLAVVDGTLDYITVVWSEDLAPAASSAPRWSVAGSDFGTITLNGAAPCHSATAASNECGIPIAASEVKTDVGNLTLTLTSGPEVADESPQANEAVGRTFSVTPTATTPAFTDAAPPYPVSAVFYDNEGQDGGRIDSIIVTWSENLVAVADASRRLGSVRSGL